MPYKLDIQKDYLFEGLAHFIKPVTLELASNFLTKHKQTQWQQHHQKKNQITK
jgi:hypothetical protein